MYMTETVSVALPVYNGAMYLKPQLDSILAQLKPNDELVVAYQPSTDRSLEILEQYQKVDARVKVYPNEKTGVTANFDLALSKCQGNYIFISDQDDVWVEGKRDRCVETLQQSGAELVIHNAVHTDDALVPQKETFFEIYPIGPGRWKNIKKPRMSGCCMAMTRDMRDRVLPIPEMHGYDQWIAVLAEWSGKITYLDDVLLLHRLHGDNVTTGTRKLSVVLRCRVKLMASLVMRLIRIQVRGR